MPDETRKAYNEIMGWADLRLRQQHHAQECCKTSRSIGQEPTEAEQDLAADRSGMELLMAAGIIAKHSGFLQEHDRNYSELLGHYWGEGAKPYLDNKWRVFWRESMKP